eukprot:351973-Chlamydomonas_euryale.AAC.3
MEGLLVSGGGGRERGKVDSRKAGFFIPPENKGLRSGQHVAGELKALGADVVTTEARARQDVSESNPRVLASRTCARPAAMAPDPGGRLGAGGWWLSDRRGYDGVGKRCCRQRRGPVPTGFAAYQAAADCFHSLPVLGSSSTPYHSHLNLFHHPRSFPTTPLASARPPRLSPPAPSVSFPRCSCPPAHTGPLFVRCINYFGGGRRSSLRSRVVTTRLRVAGGGSGDGAVPPS